MTVKRNPKTNQEELTLTRTDISWRSAVLILILSAHPVGQSFLVNLGFPIPKTPETSQLTELRKEMETIKTEIHSIKQNVSSLSTKVEFAVSGFDVDFRRNTTPPPSGR